MGNNQPSGSDWSLERIEAGLRGLPPPPVPAGLKARLLAVVPDSAPARPRRKLRHAAWWAGALAAAAALLLAVWWWQRSAPERRTINPEFARQTPGPPAAANPRLPMLAFRQFPASPEPPDAPAAVVSFEWPVQTSSPIQLAARLGGRRFE